MEARFRELILASTSAYRRRLLSRLGRPFATVAPQIDESPLQSGGLPPREIAWRLAELKALEVSQRFPDALVIGGDQTADLDGRVLGKPGSRAENVRQLLELQGRTHCLHTATCLANAGHVLDTWVETASLTMRVWTRDELDAYVATDEPWDCAGGYRLELEGIRLFAEITAADWTSIEGLPLLATQARLIKFG